MTTGTLPATPLTPAVFSILLSLAPGGDKHGYQIMKDVRTPEGGAIQMGPGTLYGSLDRMMRDGLVEETGFTDDERRRYYRLTALGDAALVGELGRLAKTIATARSLGLLPHRGRS